jgi:hypothetical protein
MLQTNQCIKLKSINKMYDTHKNTLTTPADIARSFGRNFSNFNVFHS